MIRSERSDDYGAVRLVNEQAFGGREEADLVEALRIEGLVIVSLVAEEHHAIVGHILFSRMTIDDGERQIPAVALAPMAVLPQHQRQGIGGALIRDGLDALRARGERFVLVVGHPTYYPRFGFSSASARHIESPFPAEAFMGLDLVPGALAAVQGRVHYPAAFGV